MEDNKIREGYYINGYINNQYHGWEVHERYRPYLEFLTGYHKLIQYRWKTFKEATPNIKNKKIFNYHRLIPIPSWKRIR